MCAAFNDNQNPIWTFGYTPAKAGFYVLRVRSVNDAGEHSPESAFAELQVDVGRLAAELDDAACAVVGGVLASMRLLPQSSGCDCRRSIRAWREETSHFS